MTILEAIAKAKQLRSENERQGKREATGARESAKADAAVSRKVVEPELPPPAAGLEFERLAVDPGVCESNRVMMRSHQGYAYSSVLDSYRILRTRIMSRRNGAERWSSLGFVSAGPGEGKSLTSLNLALAFARDKKTNVFLLDLDLRNPSMCRYLGVNPRVEIGRVLTGEVRPEEAFFNIGIEYLTLAGGRTRYDHSSEMLGSPGLGNLLGCIYKMDPEALVLVDLPPLLLSADALVVAPKLSGVLLVAAEGITKRDQLDRAVEVLAGTTVAGVILNRSRDVAEDYYG